MGVLTEIFNFKYFKIFINALTAGVADKPMRNGDKKTIRILQAQLGSLSIKYRAVFECRNHYYILFDRQMCIIDYNRAANILIRKLYGKHMVIGHHLYSYIPTESQIGALNNCEKVFAGKTVVAEKKIENPCGSNSWWLFQYSPAYNLKGHIIGLTFNATDITERKAYEDRIEHQNKRLREIAMMQSHDIRAPLCTIMGLMNLIKEDSFKTTPETLVMMESAVKMLDEKVRGIVEYASDMPDAEPLKKLQPKALHLPVSKTYIL